MPRSCLNWSAVIICGLAGAYAAVIATLAGVGSPLPPSQINSIVAGTFAASAVVALVRRPVVCTCSQDLAEIRQELQELREQVAQPVYMVPAPRQSEEPREGLGPEAIEALRRMDRRLGSVE